MTQSVSGRTGWDRQQVASHRQAGRGVGEAKGPREQHVESRQRLAASRTAEVNHRVSCLDSVLTDALKRAPLTFDDLAVKPEFPRFRPGHLAVPEPEPTWAGYEPEPPGPLEMLFGGAGRHKQVVARAEEVFREALDEYRQREARRVAELVRARREHDERVREIENRTRAENEALRARAEEFLDGWYVAVEWFVERVLERSAYPPGFPKKVRVAYRSQSRGVVIELELPPASVVPDVRGYEYAAARDVMVPVPRSSGEVRRRYAQLVACMALRTLHEVFSATPGEVVETVVFNGRVSAPDPAPGGESRPHLVSVQTGRAEFEELVLSKVDAVACLKRLDARFSSDPCEMEAVEPFVEFAPEDFHDSGATVPGVVSGDVLHP